MWEINDTSIKNLKVLSSFHVDDDRGDFIKYFEKEIYSELNLAENISEVFLTRSKKNVIRGMHFQTANPQVKYVTVLSGSILDVAVDLRPNSDTFGKWVSVELNEKNRKVFCIPKNFAHGFQVISEKDALVMYICAGKYDYKTDTGIKWNDSYLDIKWPEEEHAILSDKDANLMSFDFFKKLMKIK